MPDARVTSLMPVRDYHRVYLERALGSLLDQTSSRWELLVIDDAGSSIDTTMECALSANWILLPAGKGKSAMVSAVPSVRQYLVAS